MRKVLASLTGLITVPTLLVACSAPTDETGGTDPSRDAVTISHSFGETVIDNEPERIVTLGAAATDAVLSLAPDKLVGAAASPVTESGISPWQESAFAGNTIDLLTMDAAGGFDLTAILALDPDLVFAQEAGNAQEIFERLDGAVTVIPYSHAPLSDPWQEVTREVGAALGVGERADELIDSVEAHSDDAPEGLAGRTWTFSAVPAPGIVNVLQNPDDPMARFFAGYEMRIPSAVGDLPEFAQNPGTAAIAAENYDLLAADLVIIAGGTEAASEEVSGSPVFRAATTNSVVWLTDFVTAMGLRSPTVLSTTWVDDQLQEHLNAVAQL